MKTILTISTVFFLIVFAGCEPKAEKQELITSSGEAPSLNLGGEKKLLTVDFKEGETLRYRFASEKDIELNWDPSKKSYQKGKSKIDKSSESLKMIIAYTPIEVNPYGLTTIQATCESVTARNTGRRSPGKDAAESLKGKSFTFTIDPAGRIEDYSQLENLIKETGKNAFRKKSTQGRIKEPDMIGDFTATQWFLWDSISSIEKAVEGIGMGQSWKSILSIPTPMVTKKAREVTYTLDEIRQTEKGQLAVIKSSYSLSDSTGDWPMPYSGGFQMSGTFGFLRGYKFKNLEGKGEEFFNIDAGRIEKYNQQYEVQISASFPMGLGANPLITIKQKLKMELLE